eukprot:1880581-Pleurochrysis_carterae.AAC.4
MKRVGRDQRVMEREHGRAACVVGVVAASRRLEAGHQSAQCPQLRPQARTCPAAQAPERRDGTPSGQGVWIVHAPIGLVRV